MKIKIYIYVFVAILAILPSILKENLLYSQENILSGAEKFIPDASFVGKLQENKNIKQITSKFKETKHLSFLNENAVAKGNFSYKGGIMRLEYTHPEGNLIQMGNGEFTIINSGKKQSVNMNANPLMRQMAGMLAASMSGDIGMFGKESDIEYFKSGREYIVSITPSDKRTNRYLMKIILIFNNSDMTLNSLYLFENEEDYTHYSFTEKIVVK